MSSAQRSWLTLVCFQSCELHGGQIGFRSVEGQGSTFAFFVKTVRTLPPTAESPCLVRATSLNLP